MNDQVTSSTFEQHYRENFMSEHFLPQGFVLRNLTGGDELSYRHELLNMDSTNISDSPDQYVLLSPDSEKQYNRAIILTALVPDKDHNNYLYWAKTLAIQTGKPVILQFNQKKEFSGACDVFLQITNSIEQLKGLAEKIGDNVVPFLHKDTTFDFFAYGLGTLVARCLVEDFCVARFAQSKIFLLLDNDEFSALSWAKKHITGWTNYLAAQPQKNMCNFATKLNHIVADSSTSLMPSNVKRYFVINIKTAHKKVIRDNTTEYRGANNSIPVSYITVPVKYTFAAGDLFPVTANTNDTYIFNGYSQIFKMASWFLCGIN